MTSFAELAAAPTPSLDLLALAIAEELRPGAVDAAAALDALDQLGEDLGAALEGMGPEAGARAEALVCSEVLAGVHGFTGDREDYDNPDNSMLDLVLQQRCGLPILLSVVYAEAGRRAGLPLAGIGLPGHFVVGHFGATPPLILDPFGDGAILEAGADPGLLRPWPPTEVAMRILNNLVAGHVRRGDLALAIRAAELRLLLPAEAGSAAVLQGELRALRAKMN